MHVLFIFHLYIFKSIVLFCGNLLSCSHGNTLEWVSITLTVIIQKANIQLSSGLFIQHRTNNDSSHLKATIYKHIYNLLPLYYSNLQTAWIGHRCDACAHADTNTQSSQAFLVSILFFLQWKRNVGETGQTTRRHHTQVFTVWWRVYQNITPCISLPRDPS